MTTGYLPNGEPGFLNALFDVVDGRQGNVQVHFVNELVGRFVGVDSLKTQLLIRKADDFALPVGVSDAGLAGFFQVALEHIGKCRVKLVSHTKPCILGKLGDEHFHCVRHGNDGLFA